MKIPAALAAVLFAASQLAAQSQPVAPTTETKPTAEKPADKAAADKTTTAKPADAKALPGTKTPAKKDEKKEPEPKIPGQTIVRADGTFLGLEVVGGNFKLSFYNKKKKAVAPDVTRVTARWPNVRGPGDNRTVMNPSGNALVGSKPVLPPFTFNVYLTLLQGEGENQKTVESFVVPFRG